MTEVLLFLSQLSLRETILTEMKAKITLNLQSRLCIQRNVGFIKTPPEHHQFNDIGEPHFQPHVTASPSQSCKIQPTLCDLLGNNDSQPKEETQTRTSWKILLLTGLVHLCLLWLCLLYNLLFIGSCHCSSLIFLPLPRHDVHKLGLKFLPKLAPTPQENQNNNSVSFDFVLLYTVTTQFSNVPLRR